MAAVKAGSRLCSVQQQVEKWGTMDGHHRYHRRRNKGTILRVARRVFCPVWANEGPKATSRLVIIYHSKPIANFDDAAQLHADSFPHYSASHHVVTGIISKCSKAIHHLFDQAGLNGPKSISSLSSLVAPFQAVASLQYKEDLSVAALPISA